MTERVPLLLDTDIGSDIDDAVCLAYLLAQPRCELLGITTVSGQPRVRAAMAHAVCRAAGRDDIPIHAGIEHELESGRIVQPDVPQANVLPRFAHRAPGDFEPHAAVEFLRKTIRHRPGEITLLGIGPMTNLAVLFALDPEIPKLLKRLVLMCGVFTQALPSSPLREWNALCDPLATHVVYRSAAGPHLSVGLDVTLRCRMPSRDAIERFASVGGPLSVVAAATEVWSEHARHVTFHDPLAATLIFEPQICRYDSGRVTVELESSRLAGLTLFERDPEGPHHIAREVDPEAFFDEYWGTVAG